ncbi:RsmD family RNA methyltransferase [Actomonas aquatica]|uniref:RsmD family RNA methyltransferase n=1 Tax=Actomonas aquatica TaxID=2866162 RepID=A0ABZ1CHM3_9BACT|nr:RsmD family RNA methyltransferase [Opitutus sp. WL0086]WRQ89760.1 RsmD family RNA methyltransferase [Opitutus sp. WL0086]
MRISGGVAKGISLQVPKGDAVRPATDGMRQALFSSVGELVVGARFLDLFAGSGAYGLEALSRGAAGGAWVEQHRRTVDLLKLNVAAVCRSVGRSPQADLQVMAADATTVPWPEGWAPPDLVFVDPPYPIIEAVWPKVFAQIEERWSGAEAPWVLFELPGGTEIEPAGWTCVRRVGRGKRQQPTVAIFKRAD